jgi:hypothetical protein
MKDSKRAVAPLTDAGVAPGVMPIAPPGVLKGVAMGFGVCTRAIALVTPVRLSLTHPECEYALPSKTGSAGDMDTLNNGTNCEWNLQGRFADACFGVTSAEASLVPQHTCTTDRFGVIPEKSDACRAGFSPPNRGVFISRSRARFSASIMMASPAAKNDIGGCQQCLFSTYSRGQHRNSIGLWKWQ